MAEQDWHVWSYTMLSSDLLTLDEVIERLMLELLYRAADASQSAS